MKRLLSLALVLLLAVSLLAGCTKTETPASEEPSAEPTVASFDWTGYDSLIDQIRASTDFVAREGLMHQAEDMLMETGAICPIYYYNDVYMMKAAVQGFYCTPYGYKYFVHATNGDSTTLKVCLASEPDKLDPALNSSVDGACLAVNSFGGLYTYDENMQLVPNFAESSTVSDDGLTYTFTMRSGLKWSDG
ncbi:MAG TPA: ABC transporter substrate-binding protein, partial [Oscillospiraceae bacterium]|nr:ABC transporter substrate-binding protein [Oscillospiraceae bacterium]